MARKWRKKIGKISWISARRNVAALEDQKKEILNNKKKEKLGKGRGEVKGRKRKIRKKLEVREGCWKKVKKLKTISRNETRMTKKNKRIRKE